MGHAQEIVCHVEENNNVVSSESIDKVTLLITLEMLQNVPKEMRWFAF
jgi:hypothetical protein